MRRALAPLLCLAFAAVSCAAPGKPVQEAGRPEADTDMSGEHDAATTHSAAADITVPANGTHVEPSDASPSGLAPVASEATDSAHSSEHSSESTSDNSDEQRQRPRKPPCGYRMVPDELYHLDGIVRWADSGEFASPPSGVAFTELVQLMPLINPDNPHRDAHPDQPVRWALIYTGLALDDDRCVSATPLGTVALPEEFSVECLGLTSAVVHDDGTLEVGDTANAVRTTADDGVVWTENPSPALAAAIVDRRLDVPVTLSGDTVNIAEAGSLQVRSPPWPNSPGWEVQTVRAGSLLLVTAQPAHLACFSGVTWAFDVSTGELIACGANTMATTITRADTNSDGFGSTAGWPQMQLPSPEDIPDYLECGARFNLNAAHRSP